MNAGEGQKARPTPSQLTTLPHIMEAHNQMLRVMLIYAGPSFKFVRHESKAEEAGKK